MVVVIVLLPRVVCAALRTILSDIGIQLYASPQLAPERLRSLDVEEIARPRGLIPASSCVSSVPLRVRWCSHKNKQERSEEHTSELQSLMRNSYAVFCLKKKNKNTKNNI